MPQKNPIYFEPIRPNEINCLEISNDGLKMSQNPYAEIVQFWDDLLYEYNLLKK